MVKIVVNRCFGGYGLSEAAYAELGLEWDRYGLEYREHYNRDSQELVACVEKLGAAASGSLAKLKVVDIQDDVDWVIEDTDGFETIRERAREW